MKARFVSNSGEDRLIAIYAGWAMDYRPFTGLKRAGYDILVFWDYNSFDFDSNLLARYSEICVVAWSLGVYAAAVTTPAYADRVSLKLAINGTLTPVDDLCGIPRKVYEGTLDGLDERNLHKFYRRVCGSRTAYAAFEEHLPERSIDELRGELAQFLPDDIFAPMLDARFDHAVISADDAIFPSANQARAWQNTPRTLIEGAHLPDFQAIIDRFVIDKQHVGCRFAGGASSYDANASVQAGLVEDMRRISERFLLPAVMCRRGGRTLEIGSGTGMLSRVLSGYIGRFGTLEMWDIAADAPVGGANRVFRRIDAEAELMRVPSASVDVIASASTVQWFNSPSRFVRECCRVLRSGGYALIGTYAPGNLAEVEAATGVGLPLLSTEQWRVLAAPYFDIVHIGERVVELEFDTAIEVFQHLKATGVNSLGRKVAPVSLRSAIARYPRRMDGRYAATYRPLVFLLRKK